MEKAKLERFITKYNLGGACESVKLVSDGKMLSVRSISDDKNVLTDVSCMDMEFAEGEFSVYETKRFRSLLNVLNDTLKVAVNKVNNKIVGLNVSDSDTKVTVVLSDESVIPKVPDLKKLPPTDVEIMLDEKFISTFVKAKSALSEVSTFTVMSDGEGNEATVIIGYSSQNTNRVSIKVNTKKNARVEPINFNANYLKEVLLSNKELKDGVLSVSSKGIASAEFTDGNFASKYYLVQIHTKE